MKKSQNKNKPRWVKNDLKVQKPSKYVALKKNGLDLGGDLEQPSALPSKLPAPVQYGQAQQANVTAKGETASGVTNAAKSVPLWGGVYNATQSLSSSIKGNGLNQNQTALGDYLSPSSGLVKAIDDGEWGQGIAGLLLPGLGGQMEAKRNREKKANSDLQQQVVTNKMLQQNAQAGMAFEKGGTIPSNLGVIRGGTLNKISKDAVEVKAHNPSRTDSVELRDAFVDNNEIIDRKNRVFSDTLGFAKKAKALEKQKNSIPRFSASNDRIENQLDNLFKQQELSKGGTIHIKPENKGKFNATKKATGKTTEELTHSSNPVTKKRAIFAQNAAKWHHAEGGVLGEEDPNTKTNKTPTFKTEKEHVNYYRPLAVEKFSPEDRAVYQETLASKGQDFADAWIAARGGLPPFTQPQNQSKMITYSGTSLPTKFSNNSNTGGYRYNAKGGKGLPAKGSITKPGKADGGWMDELESFANIAAPTIAAAIGRKKLKGPASPVLENRVGLKRINPAAQLSDATNQFGQAEQVAIRNTGQSSDLISALGNIKSRKVQANNQIQGQTQQINADIANQEANMNVGVGARNTERVNAFRQAGADFNNMKTRLMTDNVSNLSTKLQQKSAEGNKEQLDRDAMVVNSWKFNDSGVLDRQKAKLKLENPAMYRRLYGMSKGGMLKAGKKC